MIPIVFVDEPSESWLISRVPCRERGALGKILIRCLDESLLSLAFSNLATHHWHLRVMIRQQRSVRWLSGDYSQLRVATLRLRSSSFDRTEASTFSLDLDSDLTKKTSLSEAAAFFGVKTFGTTARDSSVLEK